MVMANVFLLGYFWSTIRQKQGPSGIRGNSGERGDRGIEGSCGVSATQSEAIRQVNTLLDSLYKEKTGKNILNQELQTFPNNYLSNKISTIAGSRNYQVMYLEASALGKTPQEVINYVKGIWKEWFELIYTANSAWFTDELADEDYTWTGNNPFDEIKKYDMYYWGLSRSFRPLKAELCRTTANYRNSKFPYKESVTDKTSSRLKVIMTNDYQRLAGDEDTHGRPDVSWFRGKPVTIGLDTYYPVGDIISIGNSDWNGQKGGNTIVGDISYKASEWTGPDKMTVLVAGDVASPVGYTNMAWHGGDQAITSAGIQCPAGYESMGDIIGSIWDAPIPWYYEHDNQPKCVPQDCLEAISGGSHSEWRVRGTNHMVLNDTSRGFNLFRRNNNKPYYKIKDSCLGKGETTKKYANTMKTPEPEFEALGIGWYGHPYKLDPKYSIFSFLGLVPEGIIVSKGTGRRFYIIHYGGEEANIYIVLEYNTVTSKYDSALQVSDNASLGKINLRNISRKDPRQQYKIIFENDKRFIKFRNLHNTKYLYLGLEPRTGESVFSTVDAKTAYDNGDGNNNSTFSFISAFGTQLNLIDK
jgi:hypothetical protein